MKKIKLVFFTLMLISITHLHNYAQVVNSSDDSVFRDSNFNSDTIFRSVDTANFVLIDSSLIKKSDSIKNLVLSKYKNVSFNFLDENIKLDNRKYVNRNSIKLRKTNDQWIVFVFLAIVLVYTIVKNVYSKTLGIIFQAYWNDRAISQFTRDDNFFRIRTSLLYFFLFAVVYGMLAKYVLNYFNIYLYPKPLEEYLFICGFLACFYFAKFLVMKLAGYIFSMQKLMSGYLSILSVSNFVFSIVIIPMLILYYYLPLEYAEIAFYVILILFCFNTIYKYLRTGSFIMNNFQFPKFYLFLYLCTLEIMPLLVIYKVFLA